MRVLVTLKRTMDYRLTARPNAAGTAVELAGVKMATNPFDDIALEAALRMKEAGLATEVLVVSVGSTAVHDVLRAALAMGADRALHLDAPDELPGLLVADILKACVLKEQPQLILMGKQAIDTDAGQVPSMLAELLGWAQADNAFEINLASGYAEVHCETEQGIETIGFALPGVITTDLRLNIPRLVTMPQIIAARSKPLTTEVIETILKPAFTRTKVFVPPQQRLNAMLPDVESLAAALKELQP